MYHYSLIVCNEFILFIKIVGNKNTHRTDNAAYIHIPATTADKLCIVRRCDENRLAMTPYIGRLMTLASPIKVKSIVSAAEICNINAGKWL